MIIEPGLALVTGATVLLFIAVFLAGDGMHPLQAFTRCRRGVLSFGAGASVAVVLLLLVG